MFPDGKDWQNWMKDFRYGTLAILPKGEVQSTCDFLRLTYDPDSANSCPTHITVTQPFAFAPDAAQIRQIENLLKSYSSIKVEVGPVITSPNKKLI